MIRLKVAIDFSRMPGPRSRKEGKFSAEEFLEELLYPKFSEAEESGCKLLVDLDGGYGYATSFLEEAFGGLVRKVRSTDRVQKILTIKSDEESYLCDDVKRYMKEAITDVQVTH